MSESDSADELRTRSSPPPATADRLPADESAPEETAPARPRSEGTETTPANRSKPASGPAVLPDPPPGYEFLAELGRGGMGVVYRARQTNLHREVALKTILNAASADRVSVARFWAEAEVMAAVKHPFVVQVYELGEHAGAPFIAMEYLSGGSLADRLDGGARLDARTAAALVAQIARGVAAAHELGIVHRDLKPANILFAAESGPWAVGSKDQDKQVVSSLPTAHAPLSALTPKVTDFGLAKRGASDLTHTNAVMGTPAYMAPEQAKGDAKFVGPAADVWALGVILYECLSGSRPFLGNVAEILSGVTGTEPPALRSRVSGLPRNLDTVVTKCLAKEPGRRYPNAAALADDLERFVRGEPIAARAVGRAERAFLWARRNPTRAGLYAAIVATGCLLAVGGALAKLWLAAKEASGTADTARATAVAAQQKAEAGERREADLRAALVRSEYVRAVDLAHRQYHANNLGRAREILATCPPELRGWEWYYVHRLCYGDVLTLIGHTGRVTAVSFTPDGTRVLTASTDGTAKVWDAATGAELFTLKGHTAPVWLAEFTPNGALIITAGDDHTPLVWDAATGAKLRPLTGHTKAVNGLKVTPFVAITMGGDGTVRTWNATTGQQLLIGDTPAFVERGDVRSVVDSANGTRRVQLFLGLNSAPPRPVDHIKDARTDKLVAKLDGGAVRGECAAFTADGAKLVVGTHDREAILYDATSGKLLAKYRGHSGVVTAVAFAPDGARFVTGGLDGTARVWDPRVAGPVWMNAGGWTDAKHFTIGPDGKRTAATDKSAVTVRDAATGAVLSKTTAPGEVLCLQYGPAGLRIVSVVGPRMAGKPQPDRRLVLWDADAGKEVPLPDSVRVDPVTVWGTRTGAHFVVQGRDRVLRVWDAATGAERFAIKPASPPARVVLDDAGAYLAASSMSAVEVWNVRTGKLVRRIEAGVGKEVAAQEFTRDGRLLLRYRLDRTAVLYDVEKGAPELTVGGYGGFVQAACVSPDGTRIVTGDEDETVKVWDRATGQELLTLAMPYPIPNYLTFSPDGAWLAAVRAARDYPFVVWDAAPVNAAVPRPLQFGPPNP